MITYYLVTGWVWPELARLDGTMDVEVGHCVTWTAKLGRGGQQVGGMLKKVTRPSMMMWQEASKRWRTRGVDVGM